MKIEDLTLSEIVTAKPQAAILFENYNLDFCCGGKQYLSEALKDNPDILKEVISLVEHLFTDNSIPAKDYNNISIGELIDYIVNVHHHYVKENLPVILQHLQKVAKKHGKTNPEMITILELFEALATDFEKHLMKEEIILFPLLRDIEKYAENKNKRHAHIKIETVIQAMEIEHESAHQLIEEIKSLSNNYAPPENACSTFKLCLNELKYFEQDLHRHVHLENNILFPKAINKQQKDFNTNFN